MPYSLLLKIFFAALLMVLNPISSIAQLLDNSNGQVFTNRPYFNEKVIKEKGIKSISGKEIHYKLGDKPRDTEYFKIYLFNGNGQLVEQYESVELTKEADTLVTYYDYDPQGYLIAVRQRDGFGNYAYIYDYDDHGRIINEEFRQYLSPKPYKSPTFKLGKEYIVTSGKSTYELFEGRRKRIYHNDNGDPYKSISSYYNKQGFKFKEVEMLNKMPGLKTTMFYYSPKNTLDSITERSDAAGFQNRTFVFEYDNLGNLERKQEFKNGNYITHYQVLYDEKSLLIDDVLVQQISTNFIKVLELRKYEYFRGYR